MPLSPRDDGGGGDGDDSCFFIGCLSARAGSSRQSLFLIFSTTLRKRYRPIYPGSKVGSGLFRDRAKMGLCSIPVTASFHCAGWPHQGPRTLESPDRGALS